MISSGVLTTTGFSGGKGCIGTITLGTGKIEVVSFRLSFNKSLIMLPTELILLVIRGLKSFYNVAFVIGIISSTLVALK